MVSKKNISVRLGVGDLRRVKEIALRLEVKESDIFRFAVKSLSTRLMPLVNRQAKGVPVLAALLEGGEDLLRYFEFDADQLSRLINGSEDEKVVDEEDIELLAMGVINASYVADRMSARFGENISSGNAFIYLQQYLLKKYDVNAVRRPPVMEAAVV